MLFLVSHPTDPRPALLVETTAEVDTAAIAQLKERMLGWSCPHGLLFDASICVILRDTFRSLDVGSIEEDGRVSTDHLLVRVPDPGRPLHHRVLGWLRSMAARWDTALPPDGGVAAPFIADIVPTVSGSHIREVP